MKKAFSTFFKMIIFLVCGIVIGTLLLVFVYCIPIERIFYNFSTGVEGMLRNPGWYQMVFDYDASTLDRHTEALMVKMAATPMPPSNENILQKALRGYTLNNEDTQHGLKFYKYEWQGKKYSCDSYERYWHGFLVVLKPLLFFFSLHDIMFLNIIVQTIMMYALMVVLRKKDMKELQIPFLVLWMVSMQAVVMFSIDYISCFYIYIIGVLVLLLSSKIRKKYVFFFMFLGMCTSYFDFLTWPLITLGIPLILCIYMEKESLKQQTMRIIRASFAWIIGYAGLWGGKWVLATIVLRENIIKDAILQIGVRSYGEGEEASYLQCVIRNLSVFIKKPYLLLFGAIFIYLFYIIWRNRENFIYHKITPYILVMLFPLGWYFIAKNHSFGHYWMTWRILTISIFSIMCGVLTCTNNKKN